MSHFIFQLKINILELMVRSQLTEFDKGQIIAWNELNLSSRTISNKLDRDHSTIIKFLKKFKLTKSHLRASGSERKRETTKRDDSHIITYALRHPNESAAEIKSALNLIVSEKTIRNRLHEAGLFSYWTTKKPFINKKNRIARVKWAKIHLHWKKEWRNLLFSDESPFVLRFGPKRRIWRQHNERYSPKSLTGSVKHDIKINVWGAMCYNGVSKLVNINGNLDQYQYQDILLHDMIPSSQQLFKKSNGSFTFQMDNDPKHTAKGTTEFLDMAGIRVIDWPSNSPDLNPLENLWSILDYKCKDRTPLNQKELFSILNDTWKSLNIDLLHTLIDSMPQRCQAVIDSKGYPTKY